MPHKCQIPEHETLVLQEYQHRKLLLCKLRIGNIHLHTSNFTASVTARQKQRPQRDRSQSILSSAPLNLQQFSSYLNLSPLKNREGFLKSIWYSAFLCLRLFGANRMILKLPLRQEKSLLIAHSTSASVVRLLRSRTSRFNFESITRTTPFSWTGFLMAS